MKLTATDLSDDVEEDGTPGIIETKKKLDKMSQFEKPVLLTDRNGVVEEEEVNDDKLKIYTNIAKMSEINGCSTKEPVENAVSDSEENSNGVKEVEENGEENDDLSDSLSKCCLTDRGCSTAKDVEEEDLVGKISNLSMKDEKSIPKDEEQYIEIKSSDITTPAEIERRKKEDAKKMNERGPTGGIPTNYYPNQPGLNQIAMKGYPVNVSCPPFEQMNNNFGYNQQQMYNMCPQRQALDQFQQVQQHVKRTRDDFDEQPMKFTRPGQTQFNNLSDPSKTQTPSMTYSNVVSSQRLCGGQVAVKSPEVEPLNSFMPWGETTNSDEFTMSFLKDETFLEFGLNADRQHVSKNQMNQQYQNNVSQAKSVLGSQEVYLDQTQLNLSGMDHVRRQTGSENRNSFSTDADGGSEGYVSDVASPYSEQQDSPPTVEQSMYSPPPSNISVDSGTGSTVPSPGSQMDTCSPRSNMTGYESNMDVYNPNSPFNPLSPIMTQNQNQNVPSMGPKSQTGQTCSVPPQHGLHNMNMCGMEYPVTMPNNVASVKPVYNPAGCMQNGIPPDVTQTEDLITSEYIDENLANLKDVMETIAHDMMETDKKKRKPQKTRIGVPTQPFPNQVVLPQQRHPVASQPPQMKPIASVLPSQAQNILPTAPTTSAPVLLKPVTMPVCTSNISTSTQPKGVSQASVSTSQILVIPATPQPAQTFVIVTPPAPPVKKATQYRPIQPKIQPNPGPGKTAPAESKQTPMISSSKNISSPKSVHQVCSTAPVAPVQPTKCVKVQNQAPKNAGNQLNLARRLVANMTTDDLKSTDKDGDTYLHVGVCRADKYMVQALLERIVRENLQYMIDTQNCERQTPVYLAVSANQPEMVDLFNKHGADVNRLAEGIAPNGQKEVKAAIHSAASNGREYLQTLLALLKAPDLNLNMCNSDGYTALHCAILEHNQPRHESGTPANCNPVTDSRPIIEALIKHGADPNAQDKKSGKTALMFALESSDSTLIETLLGLIDITKVRSYFRTQAFDGSTCVKILESRKTDFPGALYEKLTGIMSSNRSALSHRRIIDVA